MAVLEGELREPTAKSAVELKAGDVRISPSMAHSLDFGPRGARCLMMDVDLPRGHTLDRSLFLHDDERLARLAAALAGAVAEDPAVRQDGGRFLRIEALEAELLAQVERRRSGRIAPPPAWLASVRELLHDEPLSWRVSELAEWAGVHRVHLARAFRDHFGTTVSAYSRRLRVRQAVRLIERSGLPLSQIAVEAGFADQAHLTRVIRGALGTTPGRLRPPG